MALPGCRCLCICSSLILEHNSCFFLQFSLVNSHSAAAAKSLQLCLTLCDPIGVSPQGPLSLGFSRQEYWSGLPFSSPMHECMHAKLLQSCPTLCNPMDSCPPGSSIHRILQARILEWVAISFYLHAKTGSRDKKRKE